METILLAGLAAAAQMPATPARRPTRPSVVDCRLSRLDSDMRPEIERHRFVLLLGTPRADVPLHVIRPAQIQLFDPDNLLRGQTLVSAYYGEAPDQLFAATDPRQPAVYRLSVSLSRSEGGLTRNGQGTPVRYSGPCSISEPPDPVSRFNEIRQGR